MIKVCPACDREYDDKTQKCPRKHCPNCSTTNIKGLYRTEWLTLVIAGILFSIFGGIGIVSVLRFVLPLSWQTNTTLVLEVGLWCSIVITIIHLRTRELVGYVCNKCGMNFSSARTDIPLIVKKREEFKVLNGRVEVIRNIAGNVWLVKRGKNNFARKDYSRMSAKMRKELTEGAVNWFKLEHLNIVRIVEMNKEEQYILMEYMDGGSLRDLLNREGALDWKKATNIALNIAEALIYAHNLTPPIVHRDIKPGNILFDSKGNVKVSDWGLSTIPSRRPSIAGTFGYMAPEAAKGIYSTKSDIFSLGTVLYEMLTEEPPILYSGEGPATIDIRRNLKCPESLSELIASMLQPNPDFRPNSNDVLLTLRSEIIT